MIDLNDMAFEIHKANNKWWTDIETGKPIQRNRGELLALIHSEISEALEGERKNLMDDKLPLYPMAVVELIDAMIRQLDYLAGFYPDININQVFWDKMEYNRTRKDHKHEARKLQNGKKF